MCNKKNLVYSFYNDHIQVYNMSGGLPLSCNKHKLLTLYTDLS